MIFNFTDRALKLANEQFYHENIEIVESFLVSNNYPLHFINKYIKRRIILLRIEEHKISFSSFQNCPSIDRFVHLQIFD